MLPEGRWIDVDGIRTRYFEAGSGEPVVFIYGGNFGTGDSASSAYTWSNQIAPLGERCRAIAFDKVGQGETDNPKNDDSLPAGIIRAKSERESACEPPSTIAITPASTHASGTVLRKPYA